MSEGAFENKAELSRGYISGKSPSIGSDIILKIKSAFPDLNLIWFLTGNGSIEESASNTFQMPDPTPGGLGMPKVVVTDISDNEVIPFIGQKAAAGYLQGLSDPEYLENRPPIVIPSVRGATFRGFEVTGQSMYPTFHHGDIVIGQWEDSLENIRDRRIYILVTKSEGIVIKRLLNRINDSGKIIAISDNDDKLQYGNYTIDPSDVQELWYWKAGVKMQAPEPSRLYTRMNNLEAQVTILMEQLNNRSKS